MGKNDGWIEWEWSEERQYPETDRIVWVKTTSGHNDEGGYGMPVSYWAGNLYKLQEGISDWMGRITHYKIADDRAQMHWGREE